MLSKLNFLSIEMAQTVKNLPAIQETEVQSLGQEDPLEKGMATCHGLYRLGPGDWSQQEKGRRGHKS